MIWQKIHPLLPWHLKQGLSWCGKHCQLTPIFCPDNWCGGWQPGQTRISTRQSALWKYTTWTPPGSRYLSIRWNIRKQHDWYNGGLMTAFVCLIALWVGRYVDLACMQITRNLKYLETWGHWLMFHPGVLTLHSLRGWIDITHYQGSRQWKH